MVKVFNHFHFKSQSVLPQKSKPVAIRSYQNGVLVSTAEGLVEYYVDLNNVYIIERNFSTVAEAIKIDYAAVLDNNWIFTLEQKSSRHGVANFIYAYPQWYHYSTGQKIKVHIAGKQTIQLTEKKHFNVFSLPILERPTDIACCGNRVAIGARSRVYIYKCVVHLNEASLECSEQIQFSFDISFVDLSSGFISAAGPKTLHVLKLASDTSQQAGVQDIDSRSSDDCVLLESSIEVQNVKDTVCEADLPVLRQRARRQLAANRIEALGTTAAKAQDLLSPVTFRCLDEAQVTRPISVLFRQEADDDSKFISVQISVFSENWAVVFVCSQTCGWLYDVHESVELRQTLEFTAPAIKAVMSMNFVHVISADGLETHSSHTSSGLSSTKLVDHATNFLVAEENVTTCILNMCPFVGLFDINTGEHLYMISYVTVPSKNQQEEEGAWSVYALTYPDPIQTHEILMDCSKQYASSNTSVYRQLLLEAHSVITTHLWQSANHVESHGSDQPITLRQSSLVSACRDSALQLARYYLKYEAHQTEIIKTYLHQSNLSLSEAIDLCHNLNDRKPVVEHIFHRLTDTDNGSNIDESTTNKVLQLVFEALPEYLPDLFLKSLISNYDNDRCLSMLVQLVTSAEEAANVTLKTRGLLAMSVVVLTAGDLPHAEELLASIESQQLEKILTSYSSALLVDLKRLSPLAQLMRRSCMKSLVRTFWSLLKANQVTLNDVSQLLMNEDNSSFYTGILELLIEEPYCKDVYDKAAEKLFEFHVSRVREEGFIKHSAINKYHKHKLFGDRSTWLDMLPPFNGDSPFRTPCRRLVQTIRKTADKHEKPEVQNCVCCCCNQHLIAAQSLLGGRWNPSEACKERFRLHSEFVGKLSLQVLLTDNSAEFLFDNSPRVLPRYMSSVKQDFQQWRVIIMKATQRLKHSSREQNSDDPVDGEINSELLSALLSVAARQLTCREFINLVPSELSVKFVLPHLHAARDHYIANELRRMLVQRVKL